MKLPKTWELRISLWDIPSFKKKRAEKGNRERPNELTKDKKRMKGESSCITLSFLPSAAYGMDCEIVSFPGLVLISSDTMSDHPFLKLVAWSQVKASEAASSPRYLNVLLGSVQSLSHVRLCDPMNRSTPGLPVHHQLLEFTQTQVHQVGDAIQPSHPLSSAFPPAPSPS